MIQRFRIGNNLSVIWLLYEDDGNVHNLEGKDIELYMTCGGSKYPVSDYTVTENAVAFTFPAAMQTKTGYYKLVLLERDPQRGLYSFDVAQAFCLEPKDALTNIETIIDEDSTVQVRSVLTYAHITNLASIDMVATEDGYDAVLHLTNGKSFTIPIGAGGGRATNIINNLDSESTEDALSANMGRVLKEMIGGIQGTEVVDNLSSTATKKALSANMGRELKRLIDSIDTSVTPGSSVEIVDNLTQGGRTKALSAEQGKVLKALLDEVSTGGTSVDTAQMKFSAEASDPGTPDTNSGAWHDSRGSSDVWMAIRFKTSGEWGAWAVIYIGDIEVPYASFKSFAFKRGNTQPATPEGGSYSSPNPTTTGWSDGIPSGDGAVWMSSRTFASDGTHSDEAWSTPRLIADSETMDYEFSSVANPGTPSKTSPSATNTNANWSNTASENTIWMAMREVSNGLYKEGSSWMIVKIKGEDGQDGTSVTIKGSVSAVGSLPDSDNEVGDGYILTTNGHLYVWDGDSWEDVGEIRGPAGEDGLTPYIHIKYSNDGGLHFTSNDGEDPGDYIGIYCDYTADDSTSVSSYTWKYWKGQDGFGYEYIFKLTANATAPNLPATSENTDDCVPTGWTDDPGGVSSDYPFCWVAWRKKEDGVWSAWHGTTGGKARLYSHYGTDGAAGSAGQSQVKSFVFQRSSTQPSRPGNSTIKGSGGSGGEGGSGVSQIGSGVSFIGTPETYEFNPNYGGTFSDPIPYGWSDGVPALVSSNDPDSLANTLWMTSRIFTSDGQSPQEANWKTPVQVSENNGLEMEFAYEQQNGARPADPTTANRHGGSGTQIWFSPVDDKYTTGTTLRDFTEMAWMAIRKKINGTGTGSWTVVRIKGERGSDGVDGKDAKPVRIRNWSQIAGQTLTGNDKVFSGYEEWEDPVTGDYHTAPFRDVIIVTKDDYPNGYTCPFTQSVNGTSELVPGLVVINYSNNYTSGYPGTYFINSRLPQAGNYTNTLPGSKSESASATAGGSIWSVFTNFGAIYAQLLVATQAYIGSLTVDHMTTNNNNDSYIEINDGFIRVFDSDGNLRIEIGQGDDDSTPVIKFYDTDGETPLYDLGPGGFLWNNNPIVLPKWEKVMFYYKDKDHPFTAHSTNGTNLREETPIPLYYFEDGYRIYYNADATQGYIRYLNPFNISANPSALPSALNERYFDSRSGHDITRYIGNLAAIANNYANYFAQEGYYIVEPAKWGIPTSAGTAPNDVNTYSDVLAFHVDDSGNIDLYDCTIQNKQVGGVYKNIVTQFSLKIIS